MLETIEEVTGECMLIWVHRAEVQMVQRSPLNSIKESKDFDAIWQNSHKWIDGASCSDMYKYCRIGHSPWQCQVCGKKCEECGKGNHFKVVFRSSQRQQVN